MDRQAFKKNILDLRYQQQLQKLNAVLIFMSVGVLGFVGSFIWRPEYFAQGFFVSAAIIIAGFILYQWTKNKMEYILLEIGRIKAGK